jgi:predicted CoA-substrate-specific enzyme activase
MADKNKILGIDIGSISASVVGMTPEGEISSCDYAIHSGRIEETLTRMLQKHDLTPVIGIAATSSTPPVVKSDAVYDSRVSAITASKRLHPDARSILIVGGEKFGLVLFDDQGRYLNYRANTSCAAGTGSFLDQQASRLGLTGIEEIDEMALRNRGKMPKIASRCAVFAKTDLIHAQQQGFSLEEICDGLSFGLVKNIADTLFSNLTPGGPMVFCGGVSRNRSVRRHFSRLLGLEIIADEYSSCYGAMGAALSLIGDGAYGEAERFARPVDVITPREKKKSYFYEPLTLKMSDYPSFESLERFEFNAAVTGFPVPVEVDVYERLDQGSGHGAYLGIDIGSTSTKAALVDRSGRVLAGFYTRTSGRPVAAVQALLECIHSLFERAHAILQIISVGTTGAGRKLIAEVLGADVALDEITAHARAAVELDPDVDTIIEIGGQDSKFTTLSNGTVTFSVMNYVCAAGTGSFIEEQAKMLGCALSESSGMAEGSRAPMSSDRCTVFMERDVNHYLSSGYGVGEVLASVLHSVRDNYLTKVAIEKNIGQRIFFQGATAKNRALVAAFEQRLGKPIMVSKFCHITGAVGAALHLLDLKSEQTRFRGIDLYKSPIPVRNETCELCANRCTITKAEVRGESVAYGFLCGRDDDSRKPAEKHASFDLLRLRTDAFQRTRTDAAAGVTVGIPAALHLFDELDMWEHFFELLSIRTVTSTRYRGGIAEGKRLAGAEFCAPLAALHGHVNYLSERADYIFLPFYMEDRQKDGKIKRNYCYYTQYSPSVILSAIEIRNREKILTPLIRSNRGTLHLKLELYRLIKRIKGGGIGFMQVSAAYDSAFERHRESQEKLRGIFVRETAHASDVGVVFLGRPYTVLSPSMNNGIPGIFARHGIKTFFQDMLPPFPSVGTGDSGILTDEVHWKYAAAILEAASAVAHMQGVYPVFISSFKCTPDSYAVEYFKKIMDTFHKPYLVLQLDEHDSSLGYETRIEAGIRSFRNHFRSSARTKGSPRIIERSGFTGSGKAFDGRTLLFPNWDSLVCSLLEACLRSEGIDARIVREDPGSIKKSMRFNTGQCIPLNIIIENSIEYIERNGLDPSRTVIWSPDSKLSCNLGMFPHYTKYILESYGRGLEKIQVYKGDVTFVDLSVRTAVRCYPAYLFGGMLRRMGCFIRPYEHRRGDADEAVSRGREILYETLLGSGPLEGALEDVIRLFERIPVTRTNRPKVAIFGDLYVRDNDVMNQNLIRTIEDNGGEAITTPYSEYIGIVAHRYVKKWLRQGLISDAALGKALMKMMDHLNARYYRYFNRVLGGGVFRVRDDSDKLLSPFNLSLYHTGESMDNILKIFHLVETHPDLSLFVQTNPSYCCPSLVTEAMADAIERITGIPIVTIEYDGTGGSKNDDLIPYLKYPRQLRKRDCGKAV